MIAPGDMLVFKTEKVSGNLWTLDEYGHPKNRLCNFKIGDIVLVVNTSYGPDELDDEFTSRRADVLFNGRYGTILYVSKFEKIGK